MFPRRCSAIEVPAHPKHTEAAASPLASLKIHVLPKTTIVPTPFGNVVAPAGTIVVTNDPYLIPLDPRPGAILQNALQETV